MGHSPTPEQTMFLKAKLYWLWYLTWFDKYIPSEQFLAQRLQIHKVGYFERVSLLYLTRVMHETCNCRPRFVE